MSIENAIEQFINDTINENIDSYVNDDTVRDALGIGRYEDIITEGNFNDFAESYLEDCDDLVDQIADKVIKRIADRLEIRVKDY